MNKVTHETHEPLTAELPPEEIEDREDGFRRPDVPVPSIWQKSVVVTHKMTGRQAIIASLDLMTRQFRAYYPDTGERDPRTTWQTFEDWNPQVRFTAAEVERQAASKQVEDELESMDQRELGIVQVLADGDDPRKVLGKIQALRAAGMIRPRPDSPASAATDTTTKKGK